MAKIIAVDHGHLIPVYVDEFLYRASVCVCVLQFQFVNSFLSLFYIAFYLQDMQLLKDVSLVSFLGTACILICYYNECRKRSYSANQEDIMVN